MKVKRFELARVVDKVKSIVQKNDVNPALGGVLVENGYVTAANSELTLQVKLGASEGTSFILPMRAFDLVKSLPEGDLDITVNGSDIVTIRTDRIQNSYQSFPAERFSMRNNAPEGDTVTLPGAELVAALSRVSFASLDKAADKLGGICLEGKDGVLNMVATDGHVMAWDAIHAPGIPDMQLIVPKSAVKKMVSMDMDNDVELSFNEKSAVFSTEEYTLHTRVIDGAYLDYRKVFANGRGEHSRIDRKAVVSALARAKMCCHDEKKPAILSIQEDTLQLEIADSLTNYRETIPVEHPGSDIRIGFDARLLLEAFKALEGDEACCCFTGPRAPVFLSEDHHTMRILVLPVQIHA